MSRIATVGDLKKFLSQFNDYCEIHNEKGDFIDLDFSYHANKLFPNLPSFFKDDNGNISSGNGLRDEEIVLCFKDMNSIYNSK